MSYWGSRGMSVDSFEGYDPTPYSGGYDLSLTYGRPLQPSDEICYPVFAAGHVDLNRPRPHYSSASQSDSYGFLPPGFQHQPQPQPFPNTLNPAYAHQTYAQSHGGDAGPFHYGSGFPQFPEHGSALGQGYGQFPQPQGFRPDYESGRKPHQGSGYGHYGGDYSSGWSGEQGFRTSGYGEEGSFAFKNSSYDDEYQRTGYRNPSYSGAQQGEGYGHSKYGNDSDDAEKKHSHHKHHHRH